MSTEPLPVAIPIPSVYFPYKVYESGSPDSNEIKFRTMEALPKKLNLTYVVSGLEAMSLLKSRRYV
jgi:hypothetical protein